MAQEGENPVASARRRAGAVLGGLLRDSGIDAAGRHQVPLDLVRGGLEVELVLVDRALLVVARSRNRHAGLGHPRLVDAAHRVVERGEHGRAGLRIERGRRLAEPGLFGAGVVEAHLARSLVAIAITRPRAP